MLELTPNAKGMEIIPKRTWHFFSFTHTVRTSRVIWWNTIYCSTSRRGLV